jgi:F0F1-type ATP synthase epsilon subunit
MDNSSAVVRCTKCGERIKYIATREGHIVVEPEHVNIITDTGRIVQGHHRHKCAEKEAADGI